MSRREASEGESLCLSGNEGDEELVARLVPPIVPPYDEVTRREWRTRPAIAHCGIRCALVADDDAGRRHESGERADWVDRSTRVVTACHAVDDRTADRQRNGARDVRVLRHSVG